MSRYLFGLIVAALFSMAVTEMVCGGEITTEGSAVVKRLPGTLRTRITIHEQGTDIKEAISRISTDRRALHDYLLALGAIPRSISFGEISVVHQGKGKSVSVPQKRFRGIRSSASSSSHELATLAIDGTAEWQLTAGNQQELVVEFFELKERIVAAYEQAKKSKPDLASSFSRPRFELVGRIDDRRQTELLQAAFDDAKSRAAQLAGVAGVDLGPLIKLNRTTGLQPVADPLLTAENHQQVRFWEATTDKPVSVTFRIDVSTLFSIGSETLNPSRRPVERLPAIGGRGAGVRR